MEDIGGGVSGMVKDGSRTWRASDGESTLEAAIELGRGGTGYDNGADPSTDPVLDILRPDSCPVEVDLRVF